MDLDEAEVLAFDPFAGDFGSYGDRTLKDKLVKARKGGECHICAEVILPGTRIRSRTDVVDGEIQSYRFCNECCKAMEKWGEDDSAIEARTEIGMKKRGELANPAPEAR